MINGNMIGAGCANTYSRRLVDKSNLEVRCINAITSTVWLPMILKIRTYPTYKFDAKYIKSAT